MLFSLKTLRNGAIALSTLLVTTSFSHQNASQNSFYQPDKQQISQTVSNAESATVPGSVASISNPTKSDSASSSIIETSDGIVTQDTIREKISLGSHLSSVTSPLAALSLAPQPVYAASPTATTQLPADTVNAEVDLFQPLVEGQSQDPQAIARASSLWESKEIRGIYMSRYRITNNTDEETIRNRVRYYKQQGINTIIHGVWGNGCPMYDSGVMQKTFGISRCDNEFQAQWLDWLIDEAHTQGLQVHAYFEKGIKLDADSPIFDVARENGWFVPGIDRTYPSVDHYVLNVENEQVSRFFEQILAEFVRKYPTVDAVQWDDYLGYHAGLSDREDRTSQLTSFVQRMRTGMKEANPNVSFDICHHNPYWGARYFAADWENWGADRTFIQAYNDANFNDELTYIESSAGVAISDNQLHRLNDIINNPNIKNVLIFPTTGDPVTAAQRVNEVIFGR